MNVNDLNDYKYKNVVIRVLNMFYNAYKHYENTNLHWSKNLNDYIKTEYNKLDDSVAYLESQFSQEDQDDITWLTFQEILKKLNISYEEYDEYECSVDWDSLEELISYYMCFIDKDD